MSNGSNCPCDGSNFPAVISNVAGLSTLQYRVGDFTSFREAMLHALPGEVELANWKPTSSSDLALQMIEWWAYLGDILTFYNQLIANQDYLRTASLDASVNRLIRVLGYRPRPGIGARATLAALVSAKQPILLPQGFAVQSKPGPGKTPQIFELIADTTAQPGGSVSADPDNSMAQLGADGSVLLQGTITSIKAGDRLLLVKKKWKGKSSKYVVADVVSVEPQLTPRGTTNTRVVFSTSALPLPAGAIARNYRLLRSTQTARLFQYKVSLSLSLIEHPTSATGTAHLDSVTRQIKPGDLILFDNSSGPLAAPIPGPPIPQPVPAIQTSYGPPDYGFYDGYLTESVQWGSGTSLSGYFQLDQSLQSDLGGSLFSQVTEPQVSGGASLAQPLQSQGSLGLSTPQAMQVMRPGTSAQQVLDTQPAAPPMQLAIVRKYTEVIWYANNPKHPSQAPDKPIPIFHSRIRFRPSVTESDATKVVIRYGWQDVGVLVPPPLTSFDGTRDLVAVKPPEFAAGQQAALLEDAKGGGDSITGTVHASDTTEMQLSAPLNAALAAPIDVLTNLLPFTRGKTVANEVLGSGDATVAGQEFALAKPPLTYLLSPDSSLGGNYTSTLKVWVNGVQWTEQPSFYGQTPGATIFVTREDENNITHVQFGDGVNGARLPTGTGNVIASYRFGSGQDSPDAGTLTVITKAQPGLAAIHNPVAAGGGADPEPSSQIRKYAPLSVLAFGRAISGDDYEAIAASTPGVQRASAVWSFDAVQQRTVVTVYVGDDQAAKDAAQIALRGDADPNRPVNVQLAQPIAITVSLSLFIDPKYVSDTVVAAAKAALSDADSGLFGANRIGIGEVIYRSRIYAACLSAAGAVAVEDLHVTGVTAGQSYRFDPGEGFYFSLDAASGLNITPEVANAG